MENMNIDELKEYLLDFQKKDLPELIERDMVINTYKKINSIIGPRRAGKTYFLYQKIVELLKQGVKKENIIYLNLEDARLIGLRFNELKEIIKLHWQLYPSSLKGEFYVFIDEPQNIDNWAIGVRSLYDEGFFVFLSGSSSKLLSKEISTSLRGRTIAYNLLPFSFREFLKLKGSLFDAKKMGSKEKSLMLGLLMEYTDYGGFPEIIREADKENKLKILNEYFNMVVYRDLVERYSLKNTMLLKWLIKTLTASFSKELSIHKMYSTLKSIGIKLSKNTLYTYFSMLGDSFFVFFVPRFSYSIRKKEFSIHKVYLCDLGFAKFTEVSRDIGHKIENIVFLELERRRKSLTEVYYWKNQLHEEVDFVIKEELKVKQLIQVCYDISDYETKEREVKALLKCSKELKCNNLLVITWDYSNVEVIRGKKIKFIPLWKWLLEEK